MEEVRVGIDALDRAIVRMLAERQRYIEAAAAIKDERSTVRLEWRIEDVVSKVLRESDRVGLSKRIAEPVWRELIERSIAHEFAVWDEIRCRQGKKIAP